jgi:hypothetical protein
MSRACYNLRSGQGEEDTMLKITSIVAVAMVIATAAVADSAFPDLRGVWKGESESVVTGAGNPHHAESADPSVKFGSVPFTFTIDKQDGRRIAGTMSSPRSTESEIGAISRTGVIYFVDTDGYSFATLLAPNRMEKCYLQIAPYGRVASCTELVKQP